MGRFQVITTRGLPGEVIIELVIQAGADLTAPFEDDKTLLQCSLQLNADEPLRRVTEETYQKFAPEHYFSVFCTTDLSDLAPGTN